MLKVVINPNYSDVEDRGEGGIRRVSEALVRYLPDFGVRVVREARAADLYNGHGVLYPSGKDSRLPFVSSCHGMYWKEYDWANWAHEVNRDVTEALVRADAVTAPSQWVRQALVRGMFVDPVVIPHGVDAAEWAHAEPCENYVLWNKGRADPVSDPADMNRLARLLPKVRFVSTFGEAAANVRLLGAVTLPTMRPLIQRAGVYLATARETFGIGTLEALAAGVPVAGWDFGGQSEIVLPGETGYLAPPGDYGALADAVIRCFRERARLGAAARADAARRWAWPDKIERYADLFKRVMAERGRPSPRVSIIVTCHNLAQYLPACLESVLAQSERDWECLVVDDASTDGTAEVARGFERRDARFRYTPTPRNLRLPGALNFGAERARGRYLMNLDADNLLPEGALEPLVAALEADPSLDIAYGALDTVNAAGEERKRNPWPEQFRWRAQMGHLNQIHSSALHRREVRALTGGYRERMWRAEDAEFWCRATSFGFRAAQVTQAPTLIYRLRSDRKSMGEGGDGDWTAWFPWRIGDGTAQGGLAAYKRSADVGSAHLVPFSAAGEPAPGLRHWLVSHGQAPLVSVVIPVGPGHRERVIDALDSLIAQDTDCWEAVVVNDTGEVWDAVPGALWARVVATAGGPIGPGAARNAGVRAARGRLILFLDADDYLLPGVLSAWLAEYALGDASYIYTDYVQVKGEGQTAQEQVVRLPDYSQGEWRGQHGINVLIARADLEAVGGLDEAIPGWEDYDLFIKLAVAGRCGRRAAFPGFAYRFHAGRQRDKSAGLMPALLPVLKARYSDYYDGRQTMSGCCGGDAESVLAAKRTLGRIVGETAEPKNMPPPEPREVTTGIRPGPVRMEFTGDSRGGVTYFGKNGRQYVAGNNALEKFIDAHPDDVAHLEQIGMFRVVPRPAPVVEAPPEPPPVVVKPAPAPIVEGQVRDFAPEPPAVAVKENIAVRRSPPTEAEGMIAPPPPVEKPAEKPVRPAKRARGKRAV